MQFFSVNYDGLLCFEFCHFLCDETSAVLKSIKGEALMGFDSILATSTLVKAGSSGLPLGKKKRPKDSFVKSYKRIVRSDDFFSTRDTQFN